jgi:hypothetical protein
VVRFSRPGRLSSARPSISGPACWWEAAARPLAWALSIALLLGVAILKGVLTGRPLLRSGLEFASALGSAVVGCLVGRLFDLVFGVTLP